MGKSGPETGKKGHAAKLRDSFNEKTNACLGKSIANKTTGIEASFSTESQKEIRSRVQNSKDNGFTISEHFEMANQIIDLFKNASLEKEHGDIKHGRPDLIIERFLSREKTLSTGKKVKGCITIKHSLHPDGRIIYSLEVMDTKKALEQTRAKGQRQK